MMFSLFSIHSIERLTLFTFLNNINNESLRNLIIMKWWLITLIHTVWQHLGSRVKCQGHFLTILIGERLKVMHFYFLHRVCWVISRGPFLDAATGKRGDNKQIVTSCYRSQTLVVTRLTFRHFIVVSSKVTDMTHSSSKAKGQRPHDDHGKFHKHDLLQRSQSWQGQGNRF